MGLVWLGVLLGSSAPAIQSLGQCIMKLASTMQRPAPLAATASTCSDCSEPDETIPSDITADGVPQTAGDGLFSRQNLLWLLGVLLFLIGACLAGASMFFAAQILASPLQALILVFNPIFARLILAEPIPLRVLVGIGLVLSGTGLTVGFGPDTNEDSEDIDALLQRAHATTFLVVASAILGVFISLCVVAKRIERKSQNVCQDLSNSSSRWLCCCYTINNGIVSGAEFLLAKCLSNLTDHPNIIAIIVIAVSLIPMQAYQIYWMNKGLAAFRAQLVVPLGVTLTMVFSEVLGGTYFDEFQLIDGGVHVLFFIFGFAMVLVGCGVIVTSSQRKEQVSSESLLRKEDNDHKHADAHEHATAP